MIRFICSPPAGLLCYTSKAQKDMVSSKERLLCCCQPKVAAGGGSVFFLVGLACIVLGAILPNLIEDTLEDTILGTSVLKPGNDATENYLEVKRSQEFGGNHPIQDDTGKNMVAHISNVTNLEDVLAAGAKPNIQDVTYTFKRYTYYRQLEFLSDSRVAVYSQTVDVPSLETTSRWESEVLVTPSLAWATFRSTVPDLGTIAARLRDRTLIERPHTDVEDLLVPVLAAGALNQGLPTLKAITRNIVTAAYWPAVVTGAASGGLSSTNLAGAILTGNPATFPTTLAFLALNYTTVVAAIPNFDRSTDTPTTAQFELLATGSSALSAGGAGAQTFSGMLPTSAANAYATMEGTEAFKGIIAGLATVNTVAYATAGTPNDLAKKHTAFVAFYLASLTGVNAPPAAQAAFDSTLSQIFTAAACMVDSSGMPTPGNGANLGGSASLSAPSGFDEVFGLQFGAGGATAALGFFAAIGRNCSSVPALAANSAISTNSLNTLPGCVAGSSLYDIVNNPALLPGTPELSCVTGRSLGLLDVQIGNQFAGSRLGATAGAAVVAELQTGRGLLGPIATQALGAALPAGSDFIAKAMNAAWFAKRHPTIATAAAQLADQLAILNGGAGAADVFTARTQFQTIYTQSLASDASLHSSCDANATALLPALAGMNCFEVMDIAAYFTQVARQWAFFPQLAWNFPVPTTAANRNGMHMSNVATGPFARTTAKQLMMDGYHESLLWFLSGMQPGAGAPPAVMTKEVSEAAFLAARTNNTKDAFITGADDLSRIGKAQQFAGRSQYVEWVQPGKAGIAVEGAYDTTRFEPSFDLRFKEADAKPSIRIWLGELRRHVNLAFEGETAGPNGEATAFRYKLRNEAQLEAGGFSGFKPAQASDVDALYGQPKCLYSVKRIQNPTAALNPDVYLSAPQFSLCDDDDKQMYQTPDGIDTESYDAAKYSTMVDIEPVSGRTIHAIRRLAVYLRMEPSQWYPMLPSGKNYYQPVYWLQEARGINAQAETDLVSAYRSARAIQYEVPPALLAVGAILLMAGIYFIGFAAYSLYKQDKRRQSKVVPAAPQKATGEFPPEGRATA